MAFQTIVLKDETAEDYRKMHPQGLAKAVEKQLERFKGVPLQERALIFSADDRKALEMVWKNTVEEPGKFVRELTTIMTAKVGDVEIVLTPTQIARLQSTANFRSVPAAEHLKKEISQMLQYVLGY